MADIGTDILRAKEILQRGGLVAIPTETVYGLAANALDVTAVTRIFKAKNRPHFDPLIVHVSDADDVLTYAESLPPQARTLMNAFWPGPLTILLPKKSIIPDLVTSGLDRVGLRSPDQSLTQSLLKELTFPLAAPSANPFGYISPTKASHVNDQLGDRVDYILDGGECSVGVESTIIGFEPTPVVHRIGGLAVEQITKLIGDVQLRTSSGSNPHAPGQLDSHYAPRKPMFTGDIEKLLPQYSNQSVGVLSFQQAFTGAAIHQQIILSPSGNVDEAAQRLFSAMRELDQSSVEVILAEWVPDEGLGRAINDRLRRASF